MSENEILSLSKEELSKMFASGEAKLVTPKQRVITTEEATNIIEVRTILGKDLVADVNGQFADKLRQVGVDVEFLYGSDPFPYSKRDIEIAKDQGEMLIHRPKSMKIGKGRKQKEVQITLTNLRELFKADPNGQLTNVFYQYNPDWYKNEEFAKQEALGGGWALVKKEPLPDSFSKKWQEQEDAALNHYSQDVLPALGAKQNRASRRTAVEAAFDTLLYYTMNGERLLEDKWDWTSSQASNGYRVVVGGFGAEGLGVSSGPPGSTAPGLGVVSQR